MNSFLIEMQVFGMRIYYTCKIKFMKFLNRCLSTIFLKFFKNSYFAEYLSMSTTLHGLRCLCICCSLGMFQDCSFKITMQFKIVFLSSFFPLKFKIVFFFWLTRSLGFLLFRVPLSFFEYIFLGNDYMLDIKK